MKRSLEVLVLVLCCAVTVGQTIPVTKKIKLNTLELTHKVGNRPSQMIADGNPMPPFPQSPNQFTLA